MGFLPRISGKTPNSQVPKMSRLQAITREQTRHQLITGALRDSLEKGGLAASCLSAEGVPATAACGSGMHVQLVFREWEPNLLQYVVAIEHAFRVSLRRLDPFSPSWLLGITWRFEPRNPLSWPHFPSCRLVEATAASRKASLDALVQSKHEHFMHPVSTDFTPTLPMQVPSILPRGAPIRSAYATSISKMRKRTAE